MSAGDEKDSIIYGVDQSAKVWTYSLSSNPHQHSSSTSSASSLSLQHQQSKHVVPQWTLLPNPTKIDIKRVSSLPNRMIYGISSDHQIYLYVGKQDMPIKVREETYENQRWNPIDSFSDHLLPTDRPKWSSEDGLTSRDKSSIVLPSNAWKWDAEWKLQDTFHNQLLDDEKWTFAIDFPAKYQPEKSWNSCVRRRLWYRYRRYVAINKWHLIKPLNQDYTKEPFIDVSVSHLGSNTDIICMWAISVIGQVYFRENVSATNPEGSSWVHVPIKKGLEAVSINVSKNGIPCIVSWTGNCLFRSSITPKHLSGTEWVEINSPPTSGLLQISIGNNNFWGISRDKKCWTIKKDFNEVTEKNLANLEWVEMPNSNGMKCISASFNDKIVLALSDQEHPTILTRHGIEKNQKHGQMWKAFHSPKIEDSDSISITSQNSLTHDQIDGTAGIAANSGDLSDAESTCSSICPDLPHGIQMARISTSDESLIQTSANISFNWIDANCATFLKCGTEHETLEIGPWRDEILQNLNSLKTSNDIFSYPNAIERNVTTWCKTVKDVRMLHHSMNSSSWTKGQLEISNNDTLVFYKNLQSSYMCSTNDILSCFLSRNFPMSLTLRIRSIDTADFVTFKFPNEKDLEDWRLNLVELSSKDRVKFNVCNIWVTTTNSEIHHCGMLKISDTPLQTDTINPTFGDDQDFKIHHPFLKGFLKDSKVTLDVKIPLDSDRFSINLNGRDVNECIAFHFNPRMSQKVVVRNTKEKNEWGHEERDGVFPFVPGSAYTILIEVTDTHLYTTVSSKNKHKFIFKYKHRVKPKFICSATVFGQIDVLGIRYDPASDDDQANENLEFVSKPIEGHFWKCESASNGSVWAIACDFSVWANTNNYEKNRKSDNNVILNQMTDDQYFYTYENQRWNPLTNFGPIGLPTDRPPWSDETGLIQLDKESIRLPSSKWTWHSLWEVDYEVKGGTDEDGWQYAIDFPASYHNSKRFNDFVRRRKWKRCCRWVCDGPWTNIQNLKLRDISIKMGQDCDWEVIGVCCNGDAVVRKGITQDDPYGTHWEGLNNEKPFISISSNFNNYDWAIGKDGFAYINYKDTWQMLDRPNEAPLKSIKVGQLGSVWAVGTNGILYKRANIQPLFPEGRDWEKAIENVEAISLAPNGDLYALIKKGKIFNRTLAKRCGISDDCKFGIGWDIIAEGPFVNFSFGGSYEMN